MLRSTFVALIGAVLASATVAQENRPVLDGVWKVTEVAMRKSGEDWIRTTPGASLYIFTKKHYSYTFAPTLRMTIANAPFAPGRERRLVLTRVE